ncbi:MAG: VanZ like family [Pseudomonadota bacterium]|jgi:VanZ family protein
MPSVSGGVSDKTLHFLVFGGFALALLPALPRAKAAAWRLGVGFLLASTAGALLELWQGLLPHRSAEFLDWVADTLGAAIAVLGAAVGLWFWKRRSAGDPK